ncbi:MAG: helicase HerA domain-containing protein [Candidatus Micrarchaeia archaeon]
MLGVNSAAGACTMAYSRVLKLLDVVHGDLPDFSMLQEAAMRGVYIGTAKDSRTPIFLDFTQLVNPHVFIFGVTGSGKTYLMKSLMLKLKASLSAEIHCIDFTGEYKDFASAVGISSYVRAGTESDEGLSAALAALDVIRRRMRRRGTAEAPNAFVFLDESWKLLGKSQSFATLLREGRKYGVGLVMASQLLEDLAAPMLDNVATIFAFRLQNMRSIERILRNYGLGDEYAGVIQNLGVGSAIMLQMYKAKIARAFEVRVSGASLGHYVKIRSGDGVYLEISADKLESIVRETCGDRAAEAVPGGSDVQLELTSFMRSLLAHGASRTGVLRALRRIGISDADIADAFAIVTVQ